MRGAWVSVLAGTLISRLIFLWGAGIEFDAGPLRWYWQYIDPLLLQSDALRSIYYHHAQPPLYNAWLAIALKLSGGSPNALLWIAQVVLGIALHAALFAVAAGLGVRPCLAAAGAIAFAFSPASILYEHWLTYTYPVAAFLLFACLALQRLARRGFRGRDAVFFCLFLAVVALTRSLFHLAWLGLFSALAVWAAKPSARPRVLVAAALAIALVGSVYAKNALLFGTFSSSSWLGMNIARVVTMHVDADKRQSLVDEGTLSPVALIKPFTFIKRYPEKLRAHDPRMPRHPVLDRELKSTKGFNLNHSAYIAISQMYQADALTLLAMFPGQYLATVAKGWTLFAMPTSDYWLLNANRGHIANYERFWNAAIYGAPAAFFPVLAEGSKPASGVNLWARVGYTWLLLSLVAVAVALRIGSRDLFGSRRNVERGVVLAFLLGNIAYVALVGNALDYLENNRIRFLIEPMLVVLILFASEEGLQRWRPGPRGRVP